MRASKIDFGPRGSEHSFQRQHASLRARDPTIPGARIGRVRPSEEVIITPLMRVVTDTGQKIETLSRVQVLRVAHGLPRCLGDRDAGPCLGSGHAFSICDMEEWLQR
jgi:hypothetical protein